MVSKLKLIYAYDPLCGWCYGMIPALEHFCAIEPDVEIEVLPGGLFTGTPARSYLSLISHIRSAEVRLEQVTGRRPSEAFHAMISANGGIDASSERPSHAVLQMNKLAPDRSLEFAHRLQEVHYEEGKDLNLPETYDEICASLGMPLLDTEAIVGATLADPEIEQAYRQCAALRPHGYPTIFIVDLKNTIVGVVPSTYDPKGFVNEFHAILHSHSHSN